jgi:cell division protease FtsH
MARAMVTEYGMSAKLGAVKYGQTDGEPFLGRTMGHEANYSDSVAAVIDQEVRSLIEMAHDEAWEILVEYRDVMDAMVLELMEKETLTKTDLERIAHRVVKRPPLAPYNGFGKRTPSDKPPILTPREVAALNQKSLDTPVNGAVPSEQSVVIGEVAPTSVDEEATQQIPLPKPTPGTNPPYPSGA